MVVRPDTDRPQTPVRHWTAAGGISADANGSGSQNVCVRTSLDQTPFRWEDNRPRSWSSRTHRLTWLFCRSTRSTSSTSRRFYDSTRLGWFPIDLIDLRPCWSQLSARACLLHGNWRKKILCPSTWCLPSSKWKVYWPSFPFLLPPLNIFIVSSRDHKMRSMRPVPKLLWSVVEL